MKQKQLSGVEIICDIKLNWLNNKKELVEYKSAYFEKKRLPSGGSKVNIF